MTDDATADGATGQVLLCVPPGHLNGAMGEGYTPTMDVPAAKDPGPPTPATTRCLSLMRARGQDSTVRLAALSMVSTCDALYFLRAAVVARGGLSDGVVREGLEALGSSTESAATWSVLLNRTHHAAVRGLRDLSYDGECRCFAYVGATTHTS